MAENQDKRPGTLRLLAITAVGIFVIWWVARHGRSFIVLLVQLDPSWAAFPVAAMFVLFALNGYAFQCLARSVGAVMKVREWLGITFVANLASYLLPFRAGAAVKVAYLNRAHGIGVARGSVVLLADNLLFIAAAGLCGLILRPLGAFLGGFLHSALAAFLGIAASLALLPLVPLPAPPAGFGLLGRVLRTAHETWTVLRKSRRAMAACLASRLLSHLLGGAALWCSLRAFGKEVSPFEALAISLLTALSSLISITPNNLGIQEAMVGYLAGLAGGSMTQGVLAGTLLRFAHLFASLTLGPVFLSLLAPGGRLMSREAPLPEIPLLLDVRKKGT